MAKTDLVWQEGTSDWVEVASVPGLVGATSVVTDYAALPWYRRSGPVSAMVLGGWLLPECVPPVLSPIIRLGGFGFVSVVLLTGEVYMKRVGPDGSLRKWHWANKVVAIILMFALVYWTVKNMF